MGIGTWGFAKGASKNLLDNIASRQEFEMQLEKEKKLAELRAEQQKDLYIFQKDIDKKDRDDKLTEFDYTNGFVIYRNGNGEEIDRRKLNPAELQAHDLGLKKDLLDVEGKQVTIQSTRQRMALDQQENARSAARLRHELSGRGGRGSSSSSGSDESTRGMSGEDLIVKDLLTRNAPLVKGSDAISPVEYNTLARQVVRGFSNGAAGKDSLQNMFEAAVASYPAVRTTKFAELEDKRKAREAAKKEQEAAEKKRKEQEKKK